ncbi:MAG: hypothetical protein Q8M76_11015, partial [Spirochaetaceae bacterium]|nr:hypothetical protein [Spirochaetaceae bacterium]
MRSSVPARRRRALRVAVLFVLTPCIAAAAPSVVRLSFQPEVYRVGDEVQIVALLDGLPPDFEGDFSAKPGQGLPSQGEAADPELRELRLSRTAQGWELRATIVPWSPGHGVLRGQDLRGLKLPSLAYSVHSILGSSDRELFPPRPQRDPPGAAVYFYALAGIALVIVLAALAIIAWLLPAARAAIARWRAAQAFRRLSRSLDFLVAEAASSEPAAFYAALSRALRLYLAERALRSASALTSTEFSLLPDGALPAPGLREKAADILKEADSVRYAGRASLPDSLRKAAERARDLGTA